MLELLANIDRLLAAILLCNNLANVVCATTAAIIVARLSGGWGGAIFVSTLAVTFLILIFGEISPKVIGVRHAQGISLACAKPVRLLLVLLRPIIAVANFFAGGLLRLAGQDKISDEKTKMNLRELRSIVRASALGAKAAEDSESGAHYRMMQKLLEFNETPLEKIMTPRRDIIGLNLADGEENIAAQIISAPFSKLPVFDGNIDGTVGFIDTRQAVTAERLDGGISAEKLRAMMTSPYFVPAGGAILRQMQNMRNSGQRIALAVDGTGSRGGHGNRLQFRFRRYRRTRTAKRHKNRQRRFSCFRRHLADATGRTIPAHGFADNIGDNLKRISSRAFGKHPRFGFVFGNRRVACGSDRSKQKSRYKSACFRRPTIIRPTKITHTPHGGVFPFFPPIPQPAVKFFRYRQQSRVKMGFLPFAGGKATGFRQSRIDMYHG